MKKTLLTMMVVALLTGCGAAPEPPVSAAPPSGGSGTIDSNIEVVESYACQRQQNFGTEQNMSLIFRYERFILDNGAELINCSVQSPWFFQPGWRIVPSGSPKSECLAGLDMDAAGSHGLFSFDTEGVITYLDAESVDHEASVSFETEDCE